MKHTHKISENNEKKVLIVIILTVLTMAAEIIYGYMTNSMALLADGFHMATHSLALFLTYVSYVLIRKFSSSPLFPSGTDKIGTLSAYTSSLFLAFTGMWIVIEAVIRLFNPLEILFNEAILVAVIGLIVNGVCIIIMHDKHHHKHKDYNFMAAYYHILADAMTSILAIGALIVGKYFDFFYLDSIVGFLGGILILRWAIDLIKNTVVDLIDMKK